MQLLGNAQADRARFSFGEGEKSAVAAEDVVAGDLVWHEEAVETDRTSVPSRSRRRLEQGVDEPRRGHAQIGLPVDQGAGLDFHGEDGDQGEVKECWCVVCHEEYQDEVQKMHCQLERHDGETQHGRFVVLMAVIGDVTTKDVLFDVDF